MQKFTAGLASWKACASLLWLLPLWTSDGSTSLVRWCCCCNNYSLLGWTREAAIACGTQGGIKENLKHWLDQSLCFQLAHLRKRSFQFLQEMEVLRAPGKTGQTSVSRGVTRLLKRRWFEKVPPWNVSSGEVLTPWSQVWQLGAVFDDVIQCFVAFFLIYRIVGQLLL